MSVNKKAAKSTRKPSTVFDLKRLDTAQLISMWYFFIPKVSDLKYESGNTKLGDAIHAELKARNVIRQLSPEYPKIEVVDFDKLSTATSDALAQSWFDDPTAHYDLGCELGIPFEALGDFSIANHVNKILEHGSDTDMLAAVELLKDSIHLINCETASRKKAIKKPKAKKAAA